MNCDPVAQRCMPIVVHRGFDCRIARLRLLLIPVLGIFVLPNVSQTLYFFMASDRSSFASSTGCTRAADK
jgi:hypothetical protein